jgi:hypothetical protein
MVSKTKRATGIMPTIISTTGVEFCDAVVRELLPPPVRTGLWVGVSVGGKGVKVAVGKGIGVSVGRAEMGSSGVSNNV